MEDEAEYIQYQQTVLSIIQGSSAKQIKTAPGSGQTTSATPTQQSPQPSTGTNEDSDIVVFMGGRDDRKDRNGNVIDKSLSKQVELLKQGLNGKTVISHRYTELSKVLASIKANPNASVVLFSAGCSRAGTIAGAVKNKNRMFILEPYAISSNTVETVQTAVRLGVPNKNVFVGNTVERGKGIVPNATKIQSPSHWGALTEVGGYVK